LTLSPLSHLSIHSFSCDGVNPVRTGSHGPRAPMPPSSAFWMRTNVDFGVVPSPGTKGNYMIVCDTFGLPKGAPDRDNAVAWLKVCGSQEGQAAFNPKKGSIPARTDVSASIFDVIAQGFIGEFKTDKLVPSSAHGSATPQNFANAVNDEMGQFIQNKDVSKTASNLQKLSDEFLKTS